MIRALLMRGIRQHGRLIAVLCVGLVLFEAAVVWATAGIGMGREATLYLTSKGVRVTGIDAWGWEAPLLHMGRKFAETGDPSIIWEGHYAGIDTPYCHMEKLYNLEKLPASGFVVSCFPFKIKSASAGWTRAVALFD